MTSEDNRGGERVPAAMRIKLKYPDVETFIQRYSVNISRGGIFIATRSPKPVGTLIRFEFQLQNSAPVIRGEGQVIWVKPYDPEQPRRVHGMGVRFTRLDVESRHLIDRALQWKKEHESAAPQEASDEPAEASGTSVPEGHLDQPSTPPAPAAERDAGLFPQAEVEERAAPAPPPPQVEQSAATYGGDDVSEIIAELSQSTQSQVVRAAHHITEMTSGHNIFPEDRELAELLKPLRIPMPETGREASLLLEQLLEGRT